MQTPFHIPSVDSDLSQTMSRGFEDALVEALQPVRGFALAATLNACFESRIFDALDCGKKVPVRLLAQNLGLDEARMEGTLRFLQVEGFVSVVDGQVELTDRCRAILKFWPWYEMLVGGYGETFLNLSSGLKLNQPPLARRLDKVGSGSCGISRYDAIPLTKRLLLHCKLQPRRVVDLGCGNALYLAELCGMFEGLQAIGVEPGDSYSRATQLICDTQLSDRVTLFNATAVEFIELYEGEPADAVLLGFVLHEILGQEGEAGVIHFLKCLVQKFPLAKIVVIEVEQEIENGRRMGHPLARAYYNPYFLLHHFTNQRLEKQPFWERIFASAGLIVAKVYTTDPRVDSTGFELGFLLEAAS